MDIEKQLLLFHWDDPSADLKLRVAKIAQVLEFRPEQNRPWLSTQLATMVVCIGSTLGVGTV